MRNFLQQHGKLLACLLFFLFFALLNGAAHAAGWFPAHALDTERSYHTAILLGDGRVLVAGGYNGSAGALDSAELYDPSTDTWSAATDNLTVARYHHAATMLPDGRILVTGGSGSSGPLNSAELYDPATDTWSDAGNLATARRHHTATLLADGRVLVAGGSDGNALATAELYDPVFNSWTVIEDALAAARYDHTATLLADGRVLFAGGSNGGYLDSVELYNPSEETWSYSAGILDTARSGHTATLLVGGKVMIAGGEGATGYINSTELYDPAHGISLDIASLANARRYHSATLLPGGQVLVIGGTDGEALNSAELYNPVEETWSVINPPPAAARFFHAATLLGDGRVLVTGGYNGDYLASAELYDSSTDTWNDATPLTAARAYHSATLLADGRILVAGGFGSDIGELGADYLASAQLYDPEFDIWSAAGSLANARYQHTATLLGDGRVLVAGGYNKVNNQLNSVELYDPELDEWSAAQSLNESRYMHSATLLGDGRVLVAGGYDSGTGYRVNAELYDPAEGTWSGAGGLNIGRSGHTATLLGDGRVLIAGGYGSEGYLNSAELYDPELGTWSLTDSLATARLFHTATLLVDGRVLVAGGYNGSYIDVAELYDPATDTWSPAARLIDARDDSHTATLLGDGRVLVAGGYNNTKGYLSSAELYDPATDTWSPAGDLTPARRFHSATLLGDGRILIAGGNYNFAYLDSADLYHKELGFDEDWRPAIASIPSPVTLLESFSFTGSGFKGVGNTEASSGGTNNSATNFPLAQIRSMANGQTQWLAPQNFTAAGYTAEPLGSFPVGPAWITVFVNGIPSIARHVVVEKAATDEKLPATVILGSLSQTYDGSARAATAITSPPGLSVEFTYDGSPVAPITAGSYVVVGTVNDHVYQGSASGVLTISKAAVSVTLDNLVHIYDGTPKTAAAITEPYGLVVDLTYNDSAEEPINAGSYAVVGAVNELNYQGSASSVLTISKAAASVTLDNLAHIYDGGPKTAAATTEPPGLNVDLTYNDSAEEPINAGSYAVVGVINNINYSGMASGTFVISPVLPAITTVNPSSVSATAALCGGEVKSEGGAPVTERGICWNESGSPTLADTCMSESSGTGSFVTILSRLAPGTTYYARAYAANSAGTAYGNEIFFTTTSTWLLSVAVDGRGSGTVTSDPSGIDCGSDCEWLYEDSVEVTLSATPDANSRFTGWSGDDDCEDGVVTMTGDVNCMANFYRFPWAMFLPAMTTNATP